LEGVFSPFSGSQEVDGTGFDTRPSLRSPQAAHINCPIVFFNVQTVHIQSLSPWRAALDFFAKHMAHDSTSCEPEKGEKTPSNGKSVINVKEQAKRNVQKSESSKSLDLDMNKTECVRERNKGSNKSDGFDLFNLEKYKIKHGTQSKDIDYSRKDQSAKSVEHVQNCKIVDEKKNTSSDKLKKDIKGLENALPILLNVQAEHFHFCSFSRLNFPLSGVLFFFSFSKELLFFFSKLLSFFSFSKPLMSFFNLSELVFFFSSTILRY
jgi:hypothetical protein